MIKLFDNRYGLMFAILGVLLQVFAFFYTGASILSLISGVSGIFAVVLCAESNTDGDSSRITSCQFRKPWNGADGNDWSCRI